MRLTLSLLLSVFVVACAAETTPPTDNPECQIQVEGERSPGYPYDLAKYESEVLPVLAANCSGAGCHAPPDGKLGFNVWSAAAQGNCEFAQTFNSLADKIDLANPGNSPLLVAISGAMPTHPLAYQPGDPKLEVLEAFVETAAAVWEADGGGVTPPPGASPYDYDVYQSTIQPILDGAEGRGCAGSGCHGTSAGNFTLVANPAPGSADMEANFLAVTARGNLETPESSLFLLQATNKHAAGTSALASPDQGAAILAWIQDAKENAGDGGNVNCAPTDRFNLAVFRDEILPILSGDVDLNGGDGNIGCTRGPCHGTNRGPGVLYLADGADPAANLTNFSCFVDLTNPSRSEVLLCPLDDPGCRKNPHPGSDVFGGADDLNYQRLLAYLYGSQLDASPLDFAFFVRRINTIFNDLAAVENGAQNRTCADSSCHGITVVGQPAPNGSNFPILANAADPGRLTYNLASASSFVNFLSPEESSLFLYPTNEIANVEDHPLATGLPHPGGEDFAVDSRFALDILRWAAGIRPNNQGFMTDWLVAGDYSASRITDLTPIDEINGQPGIFDPTGASQFNAGQWDGLFANDNGDDDVDLNLAFPRDATAGRIAYAVAYLVNTTGLPITAQMTITSENAIRVYVGTALVAQADDASNGAAAIAQLPAYSTAKTATRVLIKVFQRADDPEFGFSLQLRDDLGNLLTDDTGELVLLLGPQGGI